MQILSGGDFVNTPMSEDATNIHSNSIQTILDSLIKRVQKTPSSCAYNFLDNNLNISDSLSSSELLNFSMSLSEAIENVSDEGDRILLLLPQSLYYVKAIYGTLLSQRIAVPLYPPLNPHHYEMVSTIAKDCTATTIISTHAIQKKLSQGDLDNYKWIFIDDINEPSQKDIFTTKLPSEDTIALLQYTSGSTSLPKGVIIRHKNLLSNLKMIQKSFAYDINSSFMGWLPLFHDMGLVGNLFLPMYLGSTSFLMSPTQFMSDPLRWLRAISKYQIVASGGPDFAFRICCERLLDSETDIDLSSWKTAYSGSEPIHFETLQLFSKKFSPFGFNESAICPTYGMAEATLFVSGGLKSKLKACSVNKDFFKRGIIKIEKGNNAHLLVNCGPSSVLNQKVVCINPEDLSLLPPFQIGEICIQGQNVSEGYWGNDSMKKIKINGLNGLFFKTGDLGFLDNHNDLIITGRLKDLIIYEGKNIFPGDIERLIESNSESIITHGTAVFELSKNKINRIISVVEIRRDHIKKFDKDLLGRTIHKDILNNFQIPIDEIYFVKPSVVKRTTSGKIKRSATKNLVASNTLQSLSTWKKSENFNTDYNTKQLSLNEVEETLIETLEKITQSIDISIHSKITQLSLDSMMLVQLFIELEDKLGVSLSYQDINSVQILSEISGLIFKRLAPHHQNPPIVGTPDIKILQKKSWLKKETKPLINLFACNEIKPVDSASIVYLPETLPALSGLSKGDILYQFLQDSPTVYSILELTIGSIAIIIAPIFSDELYTTSLNRDKKLSQSIEMAKHLGAKTVSFAGILPSATNYLKTPTFQIHNDSGTKMTTGHGTTVASVILYIKKSLAVADRVMQNEIVGFLGVGSIGTSTLELMLEALPHPKEIILCDLELKRNYLEDMKSQLVSKNKFKGKITIQTIKNKFSDNFYQASLIVGATNVPAVLDIDKLSPGTIVVDDSSPHCFDVEKAHARQSKLTDLLITEGGILKGQTEIRETRYHPPIMSKLEPHLPGIFTKRNSKEITSCILSSLLSQKFKNAPTTTGKVLVQDSLAHIEQLESLGFSSSDFRLEGKPVPYFSSNKANSLI